MNQNPIERTIYRILNTPTLWYPYPHFYATDVFPDDFYTRLVSALPGDEAYAPLPGGYKSRAALNDHFIELDGMVEGYLGPHFAQALLSKFQKPYGERFPNGKPQLRTEIRFIRDSEGYSIGPHTDAPHKVLSLLFYLPMDFSDSAHGTGIYVPDDGVKTCRGGPHYPFSGFTEVWRAPFLPNSCFGFWKTPNSWHAVEKICDKIRRDVMLYNIYHHVEPTNGDQSRGIPQEGQ